MTDPVNAPSEDRPVGLRRRLRHLYVGDSPAARRFRLTLLTVDIVTIVFFIGTTMIEPAPWVFAADIVIAFVLILEFAARWWLADNRARFFFDFVNLTDLVVILTLLLAVFTDSWAFLRVLRALRLVHSYHLLRDLRSRYAFFARNEDVILSSVNLAVFLFVITALVYVLEKDVDPQITSYVDALYFTVTTLTTTGFGDITLDGTTGRILSIVIMVVGVSLFLRLIQTIFRPTKVRHRCPDCGLSRHDTDAVHCKHCGRVLNIESEGD
jgi:voltage-gated potassium channel